MISRPVTMFIFAYNHEDVIADAIRSSLKQSYPNLQIIISDDASTDKTYGVASEVVSGYSGAHELLLRRNERNMGLVSHVNLAFELAKHELIVFAAGDDLSLPDRVSQLAKNFWNDEDRPLLLHSQAIPFFEANRGLVMSPPNARNKFSPRTLARQPTFYVGPTAAVAKEMQQIFGPLKSSGLVEDTALGFRAKLLARIKYIPEPLLLYRLGQGISSRTNFFQYASFQRVLDEKLFLASVLHETFRQRLVDIRSVRDTLTAEFYDEVEGELLLRADESKLRLRTVERLIACLGTADQRWLARLANFGTRELILCTKVAIIWARRAAIVSYNRAFGRF